MIGAMIIAMSMQAKPRPKPIEVMCLQAGLVVYHGYATNFVQHGPQTFSFYDIKSRQKRLYLTPCFRWLEGTWEESKFRPAIPK